jgi:hypothetical protein
MKLIKCGSSQTRIAQACDRCRSKKIRCDGIQPCCSQCANVGFECKTSDKLSRRAFPRGYTEGLEDRVRQLEGDLKDCRALVDAKDEQLEMVSKVHSLPHYSPPASSTSGTTHTVRKGSGNTPEGRVTADFIITVRESQNLFNITGPDGFYMGSSSGITFIGMVSLHSKRFSEKR